MEDPNVRSAIYDNLRREKIKLVDTKTNQPVYTQQTTMLGQKGDDIDYDNHEDEVGENHDIIKDKDRPTIGQIQSISTEQTKVHLEPKALDEICK